ncbi:MAG: DEAD/DEAH box helicase [Pseudomonadota bacterium]
MSSILPHAETILGLYPERTDPHENAFDRWTRGMVGGALLRLRPFRARLSALARQAGVEADAVAQLDDATLVRQMQIKSRQAMLGGGLAPALACVREAAARSLAKRPFDVQLMGAAALMAGKLAEMQTGEGKTLTAALAASVAACAGVPAHVVTVNDYLAERDAAEMRPLFEFLGLTVGTIVTGMSLDARRAAYACDITYCTNKELVFDYLKDRVAAGGRASRAQVKVRALLGGEKQAGMLLRGLHFAIVDEADSIMIDEARTPLILAEKGPTSGDPSMYKQALALARELTPGTHFELSLARRELHLKDEGKAELYRRTRGMDGVWRSAQGREQLVAQALRALLLFHRDQHYLVSKARKVEIIDEYTGRVLEGRTWEQGLHQLIEAKENCMLSEHNRTLARITYQRFFRRYLRLSGMTGTAREVAGELHAVYGLEVVAIPTNRPSRRVLEPARCYPDAAAKWRAVAEESARLIRRNAPVLIGTRSLEASEQLSAVLKEMDLPHRVLNARQDAEEAEIVADAGLPGRITVATNMAGRGTDIRLGCGVAEVGGLHVILTEFHDSPRVDRQLIGRCARQGDPGQASVIVALDDALFREYGGWMVRLLRRLGRGSPLPMQLTLLRRHCQRAAERIHGRERRDTLKQDRELDTLLAFAGNQI